MSEYIVCRHVLRQPIFLSCVEIQYVIFTSRAFAVKLLFKPIDLNNLFRAKQTHPGTADSGQVADTHKISSHNSLQIVPSPAYPLCKSHNYKTELKITM